MKKYFYLAAVSAMMLTSCSSDKDVLEPTPKPSTPTVVAQQQAVAFDTYLSGTTASTRAGDPTGVMTTEKLKIANKGFGVFAFYHDNLTYASETTGNLPDFMYNEHISWANGWTYSPLKYWPNETDNDSQTPPAEAALDQVDKLSFFAYAPYVSVGSGLSGITALSAKDAATDPKVTWAFSSDLDQNVDLLWGVAPAGFSYTNVSGATTSVPVGMPLKDLVKPDKDQKVKFLFQHALSRIGLSVVSAIDQIAAGDDGGKYNTNDTRVLIENVKIWGDFYTGGILNLNNTDPNVAKWDWADGSKSGSDETTPLLTIDASTLSPNLCYVSGDIATLTSSANATDAETNFKALKTGVLPSEQPLLAGGPDPNKKVTDPTFEYNKPYFTESGGVYSIANATAAKGDIFEYNSISDVYTQIKKASDDAITLNGYSAKRYTISATAATAGNPTTAGTKYYTTSGTVGVGDAVYTFAFVGDGTATIPTTGTYYTLTPTELTATYTSGEYYPAQPRYLMVVPSKLPAVKGTTETAINVKITYHVVTKDTKLSGWASNISNAITKQTKIQLENGKSYNLKLILGMTSVKLDATVADWQVADETEIWLPQNNE